MKIQVTHYTIDATLSDDMQTGGMRKRELITEPMPKIELVFPECAADCDELKELIDRLMNYKARRLPDFKTGRLPPCTVHLPISSVNSTLQPR